MDDDKKPIVKPLVNKNIRLEENRRNSFKLWIIEDFLSKKDNMEDFTNMKENISLIDNVINKPKEEEDDEGNFTLSQCLELINQPEPGSESESGDESETDRKPVPDELSNAPREVIDHDKDDYVSSIKKECNNENDAADTHFSQDLHSNDNFSLVKVKEEPIEDPESNDDFPGQAMAEPTNDDIEDPKSFQTPKNTKTIKTGGVSTGRISSRRSRLSSLKIEKTNRKITDFFPITSKSKNLTNTPQSKLTEADNLFILSAVQGDGNFCILCQKKFSANYLKTHLINQHGVSKDIFPTGRKIKKEDSEILVKDED